ncbi:MAG: MFS transporter [Pseudomonadota bacterium]
MSVNASEFKHGWPTLLAAMVGTMCGVQTLTAYTQGFLVEPVTAEFGWSRAQFFLSFSVLQLAAVVTAPVVGGIAERYGLKLIGIIGLIGHAVGYWVLSYGNGSLAVFYGSFVLLAVLSAGSLPIIWTTAINQWFDRNRGTAIGITMAGTGLGAFLLPPIVVYASDSFGWRFAYQALGTGALILALPIVLALFQPRTGRTATTAASSPPTSWGLTRREAFATKQFWILGAVLFTTVLVVGGMLSNFPLIMAEEGLSRQQIAPIAAVMGITVIVGRVTVGVLADRFWAPAIGIVVFSVMGCGILSLALMDGVTIPVAFVIAVTIGFAAGAELDLLIYLSSKYFGVRHFAAVFGAVFVFFTIGAGIAGPVFGAISQSIGSYTPLLYASVGVLVVSVLLFLALGAYPHDNQTTDN